MGLLHLLIVGFEFILIKLKLRRAIEMQPVQPNWPQKGPGNSIESIFCQICCVFKEELRVEVQQFEKYDFIAFIGFTNFITAQEFSGVVINRKC